MAIKRCNLKNDYVRPEDEFGESWEPKNEGDSIEGVLKEKKIGQTDNKSNVWMVENSNGMFAVWGCHQIDKVLSELEIPCVVKIVFKRKKKLKTAGRKVKIFDIMYADVPKDFDPDIDILDVSEEKVENGEN